MPSRKIVSILIIASALVSSIILAFGDKRTTETLTGGLLSKGPEVNIPTNSNWKQDLSPFSLNENELSFLQTSSSTNVTDQISQALFSNYLSLKQDSDSDNATSFNLIDQAVTFTESTSVIPPKYTSADILVSTDNSKASIRTYGGDFGNAFKVNRPTQTLNEISMFVEVVNTQDSSKVANLKQISLIYKALLKTLAKVRVPSKYVGVHLDLINSLDKISTSVEGFSKVLDDPLSSVGAVGNYETGYEQFMASLKTLRTRLIREDGIIYKQGENGYYLYYSI